jgi:hypothetical protein
MIENIIFQHGANLAIAHWKKAKLFMLVLG